MHIFLDVKTVNRMKFTPNVNQEDFMYAMS